MSPRQGKRVKIPLLPNNVGKKSANDAGTKQGQDRSNAQIKPKSKNKHLCFVYVISGKPIRYFGTHVFDHKLSFYQQIFDF